MDTGILVLIFLTIGLVACTLGAVGILRFPDVYTRLHAETKLGTFGSICICLGVVAYVLSEYLTDGGTRYLVLGLHTLMAMIALAFTNALGAHAISRAAYRAGIKPEGVVDRLPEVEQK